MKIILLTAHYKPNVGGVETHLSDLTASLIKRKHSVFVLTYRPLTAKVSWMIHKKARHLEILRIPWIPGLFYKFVPYPILSFLYLLPGLFVALPFVLLSRKPNVIHAHGLVAGFVGVFWGKIFGTRVVVSTHSLYEFPKTGSYRKFVTWIFRNADHVSTLSEIALKEIRSLGVGKEKSSRFTYWVDLKRFKPIANAKEKLGWDENFVVLFVGRLVAEKGISVLLDSVKTWGKDTVLFLAGGGTLKETVGSEASETENLKYLGNIDQKDLPICYSAADVLIVPSTSEEGFGRVIIESLACGTPVIGANRGAIPEAMDSTVGKLISITSKNIQKTVQNYYKNPKRTKIQSKTARNFSIERYSEGNVEQITSTYQ
ncbi:glycosyltransferase family 4 protein [Patescibacteria group bacterium]